MGIVHSSRYKYKLNLPYSHIGEYSTANARCFIPCEIRLAAGVCVDVGTDTKNACAVMSTIIWRIKQQKKDFQKPGHNYTLK